MSKYEFRYLSQEDILSLNIPYEDVIDAVEKVMSELFLDQIEERGERKNLISLICKKIVKGKIPEIIADELEEEEAVIREIYDIALAFAPDYDCNAIYEAWKVKQE